MAKKLPTRRAGKQTRATRDPVDLLSTSDDDDGGDAVPPSPWQPNNVVIRAVDYTIFRLYYRMELFDVQNQKMHRRSSIIQNPTQLINL